MSLQKRKKFLVPNPNQIGVENLRRKLRGADELEAQVQQMQRKEVFRDAGLDPSNRMTEYFMKGYEGELTVDAIQAEANSAGLSNVVAQADTSLVDQQAQFAAQVEAERRIAEAGDDAGPVALTHNLRV